MKQIFRASMWIILASLCSSSWAAGNVYATFTINVASMKIKQAVSGCAPIVPLYPDSTITTYYDDDTFVVNNMILGNPYAQTGIWGELDSSFSKIRTVFDGNMADGSGSLGLMLNDLAYAAQTACGGTVTPLGASFRITRQDTTFKIPYGTCMGTGTTSYALEGYGLRPGSNVPTKMSQQVQASGLVLIDPGYCPF